jgi:phosphoglycerate kinase
VNKLLISGAMAYTFLKAEGFTVGKSLIEDSMLQTVLDIKKRAEEKGIEFLLPTDHQVVDSYKPVKDRHETIPIEFTNMILD